MAAPDYRTSTTALVNALKTLFENRTCTEAQAIAYASTKPNTVFYTSDTHNIVVGGIVYGRSEQITANAFAYLPASEHDPSDPAFSDPTKIYIQPSSTAGVMKLWWYYNGQWINSDSQAMSVPISAEDISYDLTNTPDLGEGDVQSAIESLDTRISNEKLELIKHMPTGRIESVFNTGLLAKASITYSDSSGNVTFLAQAGSGNTNYAGVWYGTLIPKGTVIKVSHKRTDNAWEMLAYTTIDPTNYYNTHSNTIAGLTGKRLFATQATEFEKFIEMPEDGYLVMRIARAWQTEELQFYVYQQEMLDQTYDYKFDSIKSWMPYKGDISTIYGWQIRNSVAYCISPDGMSMITQDTTTCAYTTSPVPKGTLVRYIASYANASYWSTRRVSYVRESPVTYYAEHSSTLVGMSLDGVIYCTSYGQNVDYWFIMPETAYLIVCGANAYSNVHNLYVYPSDVFSKYYQKGVEDGSAMASIAGLGYNLWNYITGSVNLEGFEYGSTYRLENPKKTGNGGDMFKANTSFIYFPKLNMSGVTTQTYSMFHNCTNLVVVPHLTFNLTGNAQNMFNGCSKLVVVDKLTGLKVNAGLYMFAGCTSLQRIEEVDISAMVMTTHKATTNMFRSNSGTGTEVLSNLRYILLKGIGTLSSVTAYWFANPLNWGVNTTAIPDAKQSLWNSLYTYSYDRATAGYSNCTIHIHANTLNALTTAEREQITAKGYILTTS